MSREQNTITAMIRLFCKEQHGGKKELCAECSELLEYARERVEHCPFGTDKPACSKCTVHCYKPEMRNRVTQVMRFAGPRMIYRHPLMAIRHLLRRG